MGTGASSQVQAVDAKTEKAAAQEKKPVTREKSAKNRKTSRAHPEPVPSTPEKIVERKSSPLRSSTLVEAMKTDQSAMLERLQDRTEQLESELGESESEKLDLQDTIQVLQERLAEMTENRNDSARKQQHRGLEETLKAKDHYIEQLEKELASAKADTNRTRARLKKKLKTVTAQLNEARQESSIAHFEMLERSTQFSDSKDLHKSHSLSTPSTVSAFAVQESKLQVILDLSTQVSEQAEKIARLEKNLEERESEIRMLMEDYTQSSQNSQMKLHAVSVDVVDRRSLPRTVDAVDRRLPPRAVDVDRRSSPRAVDVDRRSSPRAVDRTDSRSVRSDSLSVRFNLSAHSGCGNNFITGKDEKFGAQFQSDKRKGSLTNTRAPLPVRELSLERQSTTLSDSDSDWELDSHPTKIHSAPARTRVKSAALGSIPADNKNENCRNVPEDDKWSIATDDNDLLLSGESMSLQHSGSKHKQKSALKSRLERTRNERSKALMGPSLAFAAPPTDQLTDTSCHTTPTPRGSAQGFEFNTVEGMSFAV